MHDMVSIQGSTMRLKYRPEDVVILPDTFVPGPGPTAGAAAGGDRSAYRPALPNPAGAEVGMRP